jgi:hypothetical protein
METEDYEELTKKDLKEVEIESHVFIYTTHYFQFILFLGETMLMMEKGCVDNLPVLEMQENRRKGVESGWRKK